VAGRRVFFSFYYKDDVWRASNIRNAGQFDAVAAAGWRDASLWEEAQNKGDAAIRRLIDTGLSGTSVTAVLIGSNTASRRWVDYEISESVERGNGLLGVRIHNVKDQYGRKSNRGEVPKLLFNGRYPVRDWDASGFGRWVERAAIDAGKLCLKHRQQGCLICKLQLSLW
jgi:hypothetical protein